MKCIYAARAKHCVFLLSCHNRRRLHAREDFNAFKNKCNMQEANAEQEKEDGSRVDAAAQLLYQGAGDERSQHFYVLTDAWLGYSIVVVEQHLESSGDGTFPGAATNKKMKTEHCHIPTAQA